MRRTLTALALVAAFTATASADATLEMETTRKAEPKPTYPGMPVPAGATKSVTTRSVVKAKGKKINMTVPSDEDPNGTTSSMVYDGKEVSIQDHRQRTFQLMTEAKMKALAKRLKDMRKGMGGMPGGAGAGNVDENIKRLEDAIAGLPAGTPPHVKKMMEGQLANLRKMKQDTDAGPDSEPKPNTYTKEGPAEFEGKPYTKWTVKDPSGTLLRHVYTRPLDETEGAAEARDAYVALFSYMEKLFSLMPKDMGPQQRGFDVAEEAKHIDGFPWITVTYEDGEIVSTAKMTKVTKATHGDDVFVTRPEGYTEDDPFQRGPPGGGAPGRGGFGR